MREIIHHETLTPYPIDLRANLRKRWAAVILAEADMTRNLIGAALGKTSFAKQIIYDGFGLLYKEMDGAHQAELGLWARALGLSFGQIAAVNCAYEFDHARTSVGHMLKPIVGWTCTSGVVDCFDGGMVHLGTLDWPIPLMGFATRLFIFSKGRHRFVSVGFPGDADGQN